MTAPKTTTSPSTPIPTTTFAQPSRIGWQRANCWDNRAQAEAGMPPRETHIIPPYGPEHVPDVDLCWCCPTRQEGPDTSIILHNPCQ